MRKFLLLAGLIGLVWLQVSGTPGTVGSVPLLTVSQRIAPPAIFPSNSGLQPSMATVTLTLANPRQVTPLEIVLVLDRSAGADLSAVRSAGQAVVAQLGAQDRVAMISYAGEARLDLPLSSDLLRASEVIADLLPGEGSDLVGALRLANDELLRSSRPQAARAIVLVSTGFVTDRQAALAQAERAAMLGIRIFAFGANGAPDEHLLSLLADRTGGTMYSSFSEQGMAAFFAQLPRQILPPAQITISEVLSADVDYRGSEVNPPSSVQRLNDRSATLLLWRIPALSEGQRWRTVFTVSARQAGRRSIFSELPLIRYLDREGVFPQLRQITLPTLRLTIHSVPQVAFEFGPTRPRVGNTVIFIGEPLASSTVNRWDWDFGDGSSGSGRVVVHQYSAAGTYKVQLKVTGPFGASVTLTKQLTVSAPAK